MIVICCFDMLFVFALFGSELAEIVVWYLLCLWFLYLFVFQNRETINIW